MLQILASDIARIPDCLLEKKDPIVLYGAGNRGREIFAALRRSGHQVRAFIDRNARPGQQLHGIPVVPLKNELGLHGLPVIITVHNRDVNIQEIKNQLAAEKFDRVFSLVDVYDYFVKELGDKFWLTDRTYYLSREREIERGAGIWADEKSKNLYESVLQYRMTGNCAGLPSPDPGQYLPTDVPRWNEPVRLIDAGAYDGDTIRSFVESDYEIESIAAFEADSANFSKLAERVRSLQTKRPIRFVLLPCGIWSKTQAVSFDSGLGEASRLVDAKGHNGSYVQCVSIDDALQNFDPTLIKMDIEGAEISALKGAAKTIRERRPGLAISVYHRPSDIWEIPFLVTEMVDGYSFYLRQHAHNCFDLIMYAIPS